MGCLLSYGCEPVSEWRSVLGSQKGALRTRRFHVCNEHAKHCLRIRARRLALALATAHHTRFDYEGVPDIDLEASSSQTWKQWTKRLSADERFSLTVWRAGAVRTETRLNHRQQNIHTECDWCDAPAATAHPCFTACPRFEQIRQQLQTEFRIPPLWWSQQPKCLTRTGWITMSAAHTRPRRVKLQIAACKLGIEIAPNTPGAPQML